MTPIDHPQFIAALVNLADALPGGKPPTQAGLAVWVQTLKEFPFHEIVTALDGWAKRSTKMPAPADLWKLLNDQRTEKLEHAALVDKARFAKEADVAFRRSDKVGKALRLLAADLREQQPRDPKEWALTIWHRYIDDRLNPPRGSDGPVMHPNHAGVLLAQPDSRGTVVSLHQIQSACTALHRTLDQANELRAIYRTEQGRAA